VTILRKSLENQYRVTTGEDIQWSTSGFQTKGARTLLLCKGVPSNHKNHCKAVYRPAILAWDKTKIKHTEVKTIHQAVQGPRSVNVPKTTNESKNKQSINTALK
jgi:hypothetical protein